MHPRLEIVSGKGGVGKSALAAAIALGRAQQGARVLALATNDPRGLGAHLGRQSLTSEPVEVRDGLFLAVIEPGPALQQYLRENMNVPTPRLGLATRAFDVLATAAPGIKEVITIGRVVLEVHRGEWDTVVVDAPATGQLASYLNAPATVAGLVPTGRVLEQSSWMREVLAAASTRLTLATLAEELPVAETRQARAELEGVCGTTRVVANRILPDLGVPAAVVAALDPGPYRDAALLHDSLSQSQRELLEQIDTDIALPHLFGVLTPPEVAAQLSEALA